MSASSSSSFSSRGPYAEGPLKKQKRQHLRRNFPVAVGTTQKNKD